MALIECALSSRYSVERIISAKVRTMLICRATVVVWSALGILPQPAPILCAVPVDCALLSTSWEHKRIRIGQLTRQVLDRMSKGPYKT